MNYFILGRSQIVVTFLAVYIWRITTATNSVIQEVIMVKKVEKSLSKEKHSYASGQPEETDASKPGEPYKCSGNFQLDFNVVCKLKQMPYIPSVILRPKVIAAQPMPGSEMKFEKKGDKKHQTPGPEADMEIEQSERGAGSFEGPPKTFLTRDKFQYFKPNLQVELDNLERWETVTEIYVRGWKIDEPMMGVFQQCWPALNRLNTINLWNVGLTDETLHILATFLPQCLHVKNVILDGNPVKEENWCELLLENSLISNLSLRHCKITDKGAATIGTALGTATSVNKKLLSLNLCGNLITDDGAEHLARGLRMNRTLLSLTLTSNDIGDRGAIKLAETLSRFPLTHEEVVMRRMLMSERAQMEVKSPNPSRRSESKDRPNSVGKGTAPQDKSKQKLPAKKKETKLKESKEDLKPPKKEKEDAKLTGRKESRASRASNSSDLGKSPLKSKDKKKDKNKLPSEHEISETVNDTYQDQVSPLLEDTFFTDGQSWLAGNRVLISLNLSRNKIGEVGMGALLKAIQYQTTLTFDNKSFGSGLLRLIVNKNAVSPDSEAVTKLNDLMLTKDPFYKPISETSAS